MMTNAELMVLSVGNEKRLDTTQNTADQVVQRKRSARLYSTHARIQMSTTTNTFTVLEGKGCKTLRLMLKLLGNH